MMRNLIVTITMMEEHDEESLVPMMEEHDEESDRDSYDDGRA